MDVALWIMVISCGVAFMWPSITLYKMKWLTQAELTEISPEYNSINYSYFIHVLISAVIMILLFVLFMCTIQSPDSENVKAMLPLLAVLALSCFSFMKGFFAIRRGVYPASKFFGSRTLYAYDESDRVRKLGRLQIYLTFASIAIAIMIGLFRWLIIT